MKFLMTLIILAASLSAMANEPAGLKCLSFEDRSASLRLSVNEGAVNGILYQDYNGANIACKGHGLRELVENGHEIKCVGLWNMAFDVEGQIVERVAKIKLSKTSEGKIQASYFNDADLREGEKVEFMKLDCKVLGNESTEE